MQITYQHTSVFPITGESVTVYISNTNEKFAWCLSLFHQETEETLTNKWTSHYHGILQIQSKVNPLVWYMYLHDAWLNDGGIPTERVMMVCDCNCLHNVNQQ